MSVQKVQKVFREVFVDPNLDISPGMTAKDVKGWDSFNHINLVVALEESFNVTFSMDEIAGMACVRDLITILQSRNVDVSW